MPDDIKKNHHYIPQFYLRGFLDPVEVSKKQHHLWFYAIGKKPKRLPTARVGCSEFFYGYEQGGELKLTIEDALGKMETISADTLRKLTSGDIHLTAQERSEFASFIALMFARGERAFDLVNQVAVDANMKMAEDWLQEPDRFEKWSESHEQSVGKTMQISHDDIRRFPEAVRSGKYQVTQTSRGWTLGKMFDLAQKKTPLFEGMTWRLLKTSDDEMFLTSDNPVCFEDAGVSFSQAIGVQNSPQARFIFPLNRTFCLDGTNQTGAFGQTFSDRVKTLRPAEVRQINRASIGHSYKYVYAPVKSSSIQALMEKIYKLRPPVLPALPSDVLAAIIQAARK